MEAPQIGQSASLTKAITSADVAAFASVSTDFNPVHLDDDYASKTVFGRRIAHGLYVASFISAAIANKLPGPGSIYLEQELKFEKPVFIGDTVTTTVTIAEVLKPTIYRLATVVKNQRGETVISGHAVVKFA